MKWYQSDAGVQVVMFLGCALLGWLVFMAALIGGIGYLIWMIFK